MKCFFCKRDIEPSLKYCPHCGKPVQPPITTQDARSLSNHVSAQSAADDSALEQTIVFGTQTTPAVSDTASSPKVLSDPVEKTIHPPIFSPNMIDELAHTSDSAPAMPASSSPPQPTQPATTATDSTIAATSAAQNDSFAATLAASEPTQTSSVSDAEIKNVNNVLHPSDFQRPPAAPHTAPPPPLTPPVNKNDFQQRPKKKTTSSRKMILTIILIVAVLAIGALAYFLLLNPGAKVIQTTKTIEAGTDVDLLTLISVQERENYDIAVKSSEVDVKALGNYKVIYTVTSKKNQKAKDFEFVFTVQDTTPPQINAPDTIAVIKDQPLNIFSDVTITDNLDGTIDPSAIIMEGSPNTATVGTYPVTLSVTDKSGNKATKAISVIVEDKSNPVTFINQIKYTWEFLSNPQQILIIREEDNKYLMFVGYKNSEGYGGPLVLKNIAPDNITATATWFFDDNGKETEIEVKFDIGKPRDGKMKLNYGQGWEEVKILK